jgi:hypothetical protein
MQGPRDLPINDAKQFWSGIFFLVAGMVALWKVPRPLGTASAMGPGYFPMLLGVGLVLVGAALVAFSLRASTKSRVERLPLLPTCFVLGGVLAFSALIDEVGLVVSLLLLIGASCYSRLLKRPLEVVAMYVILVPVIWVIFIYTIQLPIDLF